MSYIRCLSNPEGLYMFGTSDDKGKSWIEVWHGLRKPLSSADGASLEHRHFTIPEKEFLEVCHLWDHGPQAWRGPAVSGKLEVKEMDIFVKTGKRVSKDWDPISNLKDRKRETRYVIRLQYGKHYIMLWRVTWQYVVANVTGRGYPYYKCRYCKRKRRR